MKLFKKKFKISDFSFYDKNGIENYLEKQAEKGWFLDMMVSDFWRFAKGEPRKVRYSVTYFTKASWYGPEPTAEIEEFREFCKHTGWENVASNGQLQVFMNENEDPVMIETDPAMELKNIHNSVMGLYMGGLFLVAAICAFGLFFPLTAFIQSPADVLANPARFIRLLLWLGMLLLCAVEIGAYFRWWGKATTAVERGQSLPETKGHRIFSKVVLAVTMILLILHEYIIASGASEAASEIAGSILYVMVYMAIVFIIRAISKFFQKKHMPTALNLILTFLIAFILIMIFATPLL